MKLLFVSHRRDFSGGEICLERILERLKAQAILVVLPEGAFSRRLQEAGIAVRIENALRPMGRADAILPLLGLAARFPAIAGRLRKVLREFQPDLVISNGLGPLPYVGPAARLEKLPNLCVCHGPVIRKGSVDALETWVLSKFCDGFVAVSEAIHRGLEAAGVPARRIRTIYNGLDLARYAPGSAPVGMLRARFQLSAETKLIGLVATITEWKGHQVVLEAARRLRDDFQIEAPWKIVFVGEVFESNPGAVAFEGRLKQQIARDGLEDRIVFAGQQDDMPAVYADLDVVVNASIEPEPLGTTIYEAMAMGRPVIASDVGGTPEIVDHGRAGFLFPPGDAAALARVLAAVLQDDGGPASMIAAGRRRVEELFDVARAVAQYEDYFASVVKKS
jgi:glycosyltransferase involved in cell wall biosynthesis